MSPTGTTTPAPVTRGRRRPWTGRLIPLAAAGFAATSLVTYLALVLSRDYAPGSAAGVGFGIAAAGALVLIMLYSLRRALPAVRWLGRSKIYLDIHVYGGALFLLLMLLHTGFALPRGPLLVLLWSVSLWVVLSGLAGFTLQRLVPPVLDAASSFEVNLQRIPELVVELRSRAGTLAERAGPMAHAYYARELAPDMDVPRAGVASLLGMNRIETYRAQEFQILRRTAPATAAPLLDEIFQLHRTKLEMDVQYTLQRVLRFWLYFHVPVAIVQLTLVALHVFFVLYF